MSVKGLIFSIEEFSTFDGPGIRTTVFLKGCPLKCSWCHNPEGQSFEPELLKNPNGCLGCGLCMPLSEKSIDVCPKGLIRKSGNEYSPDQLVEKLLKNRSFYQSSGGGVTFSGGEPLAQPQFLSNCLKLLDGKIHRCLQTSGYCKTETFKKILSDLDLVLFDLKIIDPTLSRQHLGVDNKPILDNFTQLCESGVPFIVRLPLIPGITDTERNTDDIITLLKKNNINYAEALPYNPFTSSKYTLCNRVFAPKFDPSIPIRINKKHFLENNISLKVL